METLDEKFRMGFSRCRIESKFRFFKDAPIVQCKFIVSHPELGTRFISFLLPREMIYDLIDVVAQHH